MGNFLEKIYFPKLKPSKINNSLIVYTMKKLFLLSSLILLLSAFGNAFAQDNIAKLYLFW